MNRNRNGCGEREGNRENEFGETEMEKGENAEGRKEWRKRRRCEFEKQIQL